VHGLSYQGASRHARRCLLHLLAEEGAHADSVPGSAARGLHSAVQYILLWYNNHLQLLAGAAPRTASKHTPLPLLQRREGSGRLLLWLGA